jgi:ketosteroid isomerase-like protein
MAAAQTTNPAAIDNTLDELHQAAQAGDADRIVACFTDDAEMVTVHGVYRGKDAIAAFWQWMCAGRSDADFREIGMGRLVCGDVVVREVMESGRMGGVRYEVPVMAIYSFDGSGRIQRLASYSDTWAVWQQFVAQSGGVQGVVLRGIVGMLDKMSSRGRPAPTSASPG